MKRILLLGILLISPSLFGTVVGIHGFMVKKDAMSKVARALKCVGLDFYDYQYNARGDTIQCHAAKLNQTLRCIAAQCPGQPIHFVTHSIGGLILRAAVALPDCPEEARIGRAVLLAPPTRGSMLARKVRDILPINWGMGTKSGWQLMFYTPEQMLALGCFPPTMQVLVIAGIRGIHPGFDGLANDGFVAVVETRPTTPHGFLVLNMTHGGLLSNPESLRITREFLLGGCSN
jgi:pimeloyl-ACP methyl ester carboxylesterase